MNLCELQKELSNYFLVLKFYQKGRYWCSFDKAWTELLESHLLISRPGEDWGFSVQDKKTFLLCNVFESYSGSELFEFCFLPGQEVASILSLAPTMQSTVDQLIDP